MGRESEKNRQCNGKDFFFLKGKKTQPKTNTDPWNTTHKKPQKVE
jgi:hypothetical protein